MWQLIIFIFIGVLLASTGWLIGRRFVQRPLAVGTGAHEAEGAVTYEWLIEDVQGGNGLDVSGRFPSFIYNLNHGKTFRRAAQRIVSLSSDQKSGSSHPLNILVRPIGRWTFSSTVNGDDGSGVHPGTAFLGLHQMVLQALRRGPKKNGLRLVHRSSAVTGGISPVEAYALQSLLLDDDGLSDKNAGRLGAHMTALIISRDPERLSQLYKVAAELLSARLGDSESAPGEVVTRARFEDLYMRAWILGSRGRHDCDPELLLEALLIYKILMTAEGRAFAQGDGREEILIAAHSARLALAVFELFGRNPERLLEADDMCARALARCDPACFPELYSDIQILAVRIRRVLAMFDGSLKGLDAAYDALDKAKIHIDAYDLFWRTGFIDLEAGLILEARGRLTGAALNFYDGVGAFKRARTEIAANKDRVPRQLWFDANLGLVRCLLYLGRDEGKRELIASAIKVADKGLADFNSASNHYDCAHGQIARAQFSLLKADALLALSSFDGEFGGLDRAQAALENMPDLSAIHRGGDRLCAERGGLLAEIMLTKAAKSEDPGDSHAAIGAIRAARLFIGVKQLMGNDQLNGDVFRRFLILSFGLAHRLFFIAKSNEDARALGDAEREACVLREVLLDLKPGRNNRVGGALIRDVRLADLEQLLSEIFEYKARALQILMKSATSRKTRFKSSFLPHFQDNRVHLSWKCSNRAIEERGEILAQGAQAMRRALDLTPREEMPQLWGARQFALGGLLAKHASLTGGVEGLEAAVLAYEKSLGVEGDLFDYDSRATTLIDLGETLNILSRRSGDKFHKCGAEAAFQRAYDVGRANNLLPQILRAEAALSRLRGNVST